MKKYILSLISLMTMSVQAQEVKYAFDITKAQQINVMELGLGELDNTTGFYDISSFALPYKYKGWANTVPVNAKITSRILNGKFVDDQMEYADSIKADTKKRNEVELKNILDRQSDLSLAWNSNQKKIESALKKFTGNLGKLSFYGATADEIEHWKDYLQMFEFSIKVMRNGYQPNSKRDREFTEIHKDIVMKNEMLCNRLLALRAIKEADKFKKTRAMTRTRRVGYYAGEAIQAWWGNSKLSGNKDKEK